MTNFSDPTKIPVSSASLVVVDISVHGGAVLRASDTWMSQLSSSIIIMQPGSPSSLPARSTPKRKRVTSPSSPSHSDTHHQRRPHTRSGHSAPASCRGSQLSSPRRVPTTASLTPSAHSRIQVGQKRETLLALHRESCRLFQDQETTKCPASVTRTTIHSPSATSSDMDTPPVSPGLYAQSSASERSLDQAPLDDHDPPNPLYHATATEPSWTHPSTITDWMSPSTRRQEYAKIDRASRGVRGLWRRVAPRWCQFGNNRMPFFDPGKNNSVNYEGSVRRFRMDLPDEPQLAKSSPHRGIAFKLGSRRHTTG